MKDVYYFPHDYNARQDPKLQDVMAHHGVAGIGIYWCLVEMLYEQGGIIPLKAVKGIAYALHVDGEVVSSIINDFDLFQVEGDDFISNSVNIRMNKRAEISEKRRKAIEARWGKKGDSDTEELQNDTNVLQKNNTCNTNVIQNDTNKIKGKEIKLNEIEKENKEKINSDDSNIVRGENQNFATDVAERKDPIEQKKLEFKKMLSAYKQQYDIEVLHEFYDYWSEPNKSRTKIKWEMEKTWDLNLRLKTWVRRKNERRQPSSSSSGKTTIFEEIARLNNKYHSQAQITES